MNGSVFDWWYFDAVSSNGLSNVVIIFFTLSSAAFPLGSPADVLSVAFSANFPNGTAFGRTLLATEAVVVTEGDGSEARFEGANASWWGSPDMEFYSVKIDAPEAGVVGTLNLKSVCIDCYRLDCGVKSEPGADA